MEQTPQKVETRKEYVQPTLEEREHVDEVVWGQFLTTTGRAMM
jgi:hypothetical protein